MLTIDITRAKSKSNHQSMGMASRYIHRAVDFSLSPQFFERRKTILLDYLCNAFSVARDEVALIVLDQLERNLIFVEPNYLWRLNAHFHFESKSSLAGKSLCERKAIVENDLPTINHLALFEGAKAGNPRPYKIEKMIVYPVTLGANPLGVVEISRKRTLQEPFRPNFLPSDVLLLDAIAAPLAELFREIRTVHFHRADAR